MLNLVVCKETARLEKVKERRKQEGNTSLLIKPTKLAIAF